MEEHSWELFTLQQYKACRGLKRQTWEAPVILGGYLEEAAPGAQGQGLNKAKSGRG